MNPSMIIAIVAFIIITDVAIVVFIIRRKKMQSAGPTPQYQALAEILGLAIGGGEPYAPSISVLSFLKKPFHLEGDFRGFPMRIFAYTQSSGNNSTPYSACRVEVTNTRDLAFSFAPEGVMSRLGKMFGLQDIHTGDARFDARLVVRSNDERFIQQAMIEKVKSAFYRVYEDHGSKGNIRLKNNELQYSETGRIKTDADVQRFQAVAELVAVLAGVVQFYSQQSG